MTWEDRPAALIFAGIRKLISCDEPEQQPSDGTEISYSQMEIKTEEDFLKFVAGESVIIRYDE